MGKVLVIAEHHQGKLSPHVGPTLGAAQKIENQYDILVIADQTKSLAQACAVYDGVQKVWVYEHPCFQHLLAENVAEIVLAIAQNYTHIVAPSSTFGKNTLPRVAALLDTAQLSDLTEVKNSTTFVRPIYAGNAFETVTCDDPIKVLTIRPTAFESVGQKNTPAPIEPLQIDFIPHEQIHFQGEETPELTRPELTSARVVISGGRGLGSAENFKLLEKIADQLNAAIGASRAAVDAGFVPNDFQVGQTGKIVAPELYMAIGISGAIQHLAGMKDSKVIVAINKDPEAPIFQVADYGLVGDLFKIIPELQTEIEKIKA